MKFHVLTLFPDMVLTGLSDSIIGRARQQQKIELEAVNIRDFTKDKHRRVDDYTFGGGAGMLMQAQPVYDAYVHVCRQMPETGKKRVVYVTPQGKPFTQTMAQEFAALDDLVILCGHYEGIDERVLEEIVTDYVSIGDFVLTGGELAAMVLVDAVSRLVPGVLHNESSAQTESFSGELLEYPQYSRPKIWHGKEVPAVLFSGNQRQINEWRHQQSVMRTRERRPDLYQNYIRLEKCRELLMGQKLLHMDMLELINRKRSVLVFHEGEEILLRDRVTGIYFYTKLEKDQKRNDVKAAALENWIAAHPEIARRSTLVLHQKETIAFVEEQMGLKVVVECYNCSYTNRQKHSISGLYRPDGKEMKNGLIIRPVTSEHEALILEHYKGVDEPEYVKRRLRQGQLIGAFRCGQLAGFAGVHDEGSLGFLTVLPGYRRQHIGQALLVYLINRGIDQEETPYGQCKVDNAAALALVRSVGMYSAKTPVYWME